MEKEKNVFLKVSKNKYFNNKDLSPTKILILSQIEEFERNGKTCYITDDTLANNFNVSIPTISRAIADLEEKKYIIKTTKNKNENGNVKTTRQLSINQEKFSCQNDNTKNDENASYQNDNINDENIENVSYQNADLPTYQNDNVKDNYILKDNLKENIKDNNSNEQLEKEKYTKEGYRIPKMEIEEFFITRKPRKQLASDLLKE